MVTIVPIPRLQPHPARMGAIISKLCCGCCCIPKSTSKSSKLRTRIPSLIIERSQLTANDEMSEMTQYTRVLEKDFEVQSQKKTKMSNLLFKSTSDSRVNVVSGDETRQDCVKQTDYDYGYECKLFQLKHKQTGQRFTLTRIPKLGLSLEASRNLCREIGLLAGALPHHPLLVNLYWSWQDEEYLYRVDDSIEDTKIDCEITWDHVSALVVAIHYIHSYGLVHGNINPYTAVLIQSDTTVRLSGFNHLRRVKGGVRLCGPSGDFPDFQAPECQESDNGYFEEIDWYSLGKCLKFWLETGRLKSESNNDTNLLDLIERLTRSKAEDRLGYGPAGFKSIQSHGFFTQTNWTYLNPVTNNHIQYIPSSLKASIDSLKSITRSSGWEEFVEFSWDETGEIGEFLETTLIRVR